MVSEIDSFTVNFLHIIFWGNDLIFINIFRIGWNYKLCSTQLAKQDAKWAPRRIVVLRGEMALFPLSRRKLGLQTAGDIGPLLLGVPYSNSIYNETVGTYRDPSCGTKWFSLFEVEDWGWVHRWLSKMRLQTAFWCFRQKLGGQFEGKLRELNEEESASIYVQIWCRYALYYL